MENFTKIECYCCGIVFAVSAERQKYLVKTQEAFYCPTGHRQSYVGKTEEQKLKERIENLNTMLSNKDLEITRLKNPPKKRGRPSKQK